MTQYEFIQELEMALQGQVSPQIVEYNVNYYREYIREQLASGKTQEEVFELLGSPRMIAKTIISSENARDNGRGYQEEHPQKKGLADQIKEFFNGEWYNKVLGIAIVLLIVYIVFRLAFAIIRILFWPVILIAAGFAVWEYFKKKF